MYEVTRSRSPHLNLLEQMQNIRTGGSWRDSSKLLSPSEVEVLIVVACHSPESVFQDAGDSDTINRDVTGIRSRDHLEEIKIGYKWHKQGVISSHKVLPNDRYKRKSASDGESKMEPNKTKCKRRGKVGRWYIFMRCDLYVGSVWGCLAS